MAGELNEFEHGMARLNSHLKLLSQPELLKLRIFATIAEEGWVREIYDQRFETEGASGGEAWDALSPWTQKQRQKQGFSPAHPILQRSTTLRQHIVGGMQEITSKGITLTFVDGPAPVYIGKGKTLGKAGMKKLKQKSGGSLAMLSDYVAALDAMRPFTQKPTDKEMAPVRMRFKQLLAETLKRMRENKSINDLLTRA